MNDWINRISPFLAVDYMGEPFEWLGAAHIAALAFLFVLNIFLAQFRKSGEATRKTIRLSLAVILWVNEIAWHAWNVAAGQWTIQTMLPLHLCSVLVWAGALMLATRNYAIYEFMYFLGTGGGIQALATPDLGIYGFPHFRFFVTFLAHGLIVTAPIFMTTVEGYRPTWKSLLRVVLWANLYAAAVYLINSAIGSNYLMVNAKPGVPSLLDLMPPWPVYLVYMEVIAIATCLLLYLPFLIKDLHAEAIQTKKPGK
jgi:hypothetical integral membrane protein (TIGR02206 family)